MSDTQEPEVISPEDDEQAEPETQEAPQPAAASVPAPAAAPVPLAPPAAAAPVAQPAAPANPADMQPPSAGSDLDQEIPKLQHDFNNGKLIPKTYKNLYGDQSTLGKIGTFFGLLLSGGGSGLTGQPNALLAMMDKQIDRDLEAQQKSQVNAQNWLSLSQQHALQQAQIRRYGVENGLTAAQTALVPYDIARNQALTEKDKKEASLIGVNTAKAMTGLGMLHDLQNSVNAMPPGASQDAANATIRDKVAPALQNKLQQDTAKTKGIIQVSAALSPEQAPAATGGIDLDKLNKKVQLGRAQEAAIGFAGKDAIPPSDVGPVTAEAKTVQDNRAVASIYDDSFKKLNNLFAAGKLTPDMRKAEINALGAQVARATAGRYSASEAVAQAQGMFPEVGDFKSTRAEKYRKAMELFQSQEAATPTLDRYQLKTPFPFSGELEPQKSKAPAAGGMKVTQGPQEGDRSAAKDGRPIIFSNGQWSYASPAANSFYETAGKK